MSETPSRFASALDSARWERRDAVYFTAVRERQQLKESLRDKELAQERTSRALALANAELDRMRAAMLELTTKQQIQEDGLQQQRAEQQAELMRAEDELLRQQRAASEQSASKRAEEERRVLRRRRQLEDENAFEERARQHRAEAESEAHEVDEVARLHEVARALDEHARQRQKRLAIAGVGTAMPSAATNVGSPATDEFGEYGAAEAAAAAAVGGAASSLARLGAAEEAEEVQPPTEPRWRRRSSAHTPATLPPHPTSATPAPPSSTATATTTATASCAAEASAASPDLEGVHLASATLAEPPPPRSPPALTASSSSFTSAIGSAPHLAAMAVDVAAEVEAAAEARAAEAAAAAEATRLALRGSLDVAEHRAQLLEAELTASHGKHRRTALHTICAHVKARQERAASSERLATASTRLEWMKRQLEEAELRAARASAAAAHASAEGSAATGCVLIELSDAEGRYTAALGALCQKIEERAEAEAQLRSHADGWRRRSEACETAVEELAGERVVGLERRGSSCSDL